MERLGKRGVYSPVPFDFSALNFFASFEKRVNNKCNYNSQNKKLICLYERGCPALLVLFFILSYSGRGRLFRAYIYFSPSFDF